eukprot:CAMPEP_0181215082 /NCGR_PEP_ID=MMETSP1096-20121128/25819_1 /TAXON_ID=156174 ORGANISM="Chrysochromulina ericina, Strain CCMP281" /NCGR_SAMPLE_ID=MMETSP1096 /ASSEMBLY_ACC=CAM_ASM_000453 /LENGTH=94 /DNA_ID=CAMNT_0023306905 /DNA_START=455 /DNA_END=739 /DNA_ORIENTATION=+
MALRPTPWLARVAWQWCCHVAEEPCQSARTRGGGKEGRWRPTTRAVPLARPRRGSRGGSASAARLGGGAGLTRAGLAPPPLRRLRRRSTRACHT